MEVVKLQEVKKEIPDKVLFSITSLHLLSGEKVGLVGENGSGKSSLLRLIVGEDQDFDGKLLVTPDFAYVPQMKKASQQSGGEQALELLRHAIRQRAELLILDEPTANLDRDNRLWLIKVLKGYRGTLLVVSHDRYFLNQVTHKTWYLEEGSIKVYHESYENALAIRQKERDKQAKAYQSYQYKVKQLQEALLLKKEKANKLTKKKRSVSSSDWKVNSRLGSYDGKEKRLAQVAKSMEKRMEHMEAVERPQKDSWAKFTPIGALNGEVRTLLRLKAGELTVANKWLFDFPELVIRLGDKIALTGANQVGKTSFVRQILARELSAYYAKELKIAYFAQNMDQLDVTKSAYDNVASSSVQDRKTILNTMAMLNIRYDKAQKNVSQLSGGERVRLQLAKVLLSDSNLLILDEPTNFLDIVAIEALEKGLRAYPGAILVISHDQRFIDNLAVRHWEIRNDLLSEKNRDNMY